MHAIIELSLDRTEELVLMSGAVGVEFKDLG